jgi:hypothetical protein
MLVIALLGAVAQTAAGQTGTFMGIVTRDTLSHGVRGAEIRLPQLGLAAQTDVNGEFRFDAVPAGRYAVTVRAIGFEQFADSIDIAAGKTLDGDLTLRPAATQLDTLITKADAPNTVPPLLRDFESRRKMHTAGAFLDDSTLRAHDDEHLSSLIGMLPGVRTVHQQFKTGVYLASAMSTTDGGPVFMSRPAPCMLNVFENGIRIYQGGPGGVGEPPDFSNIRVSDYSGVEVYVSASVLPPQFAATGNSCGAILLWTRVRR